VVSQGCRPDPNAEPLGGHTHQQLGGEEVLPFSVLPCSSPSVPHPCTPPAPLPPNPGRSWAEGRRPIWLPV
jgi:hypothetical protein